MIVADDGSGDGSAEMAESLTGYQALRVLRPGRLGKAGTGQGAQAALGPVAVLLDDDIVASPQLLEAHLDAHGRDRRIGGIGTLPQEPLEARDWYAQAYARGWNEHFEALAHGRPSWTDCYGGNFSCPRETMLEIGGIATDLPAVEDNEMAYRLCRAGCIPIYIPAAHGVHDDQKGAAG